MPTKRSPLLAVIISLILSPFTAMLYLSKGGWAVAYLLAEILFGMLPFIFASYGVFTADPRVIFGFFTWFVRVIGSIHAYVLAKKMTTQMMKIYSRWYSIVFICVTLFIAVPLAVPSFYGSFYTPANSMSPTINKGDYFFADSHPYADGNLPRRGDVVVFDKPKKPSVSYIKRIVGLPGESIQVNGGVLYINGKSVVREFQNVEQITDANCGDSCDTKVYKRYIERMPEGSQHYIYEISDNEMLDNTPIYKVPAGYYFVVGDNRDSSMDSRVDDVGFIPQSSITGRALFIFWNSNSHKISYNPIN